MDAILAQLKTLGLNEKQARTYVSLVGLGKATAYEVAKKSKLKRPITYVILDELRRKGLVLKTPHLKKQLFIAKPPDELFSLYEENLRNAKKSLPLLLALHSRAKEDVNVAYFEGKEGMSEALAFGLQSLADKELLTIYGKGNGSVPKLYNDYNEQLAAQGTRIRGLAPKHGSLAAFREMDKRFGWDIKQLPETQLSSESSVEIADGFVRILLYKHEQAVIVENAEFTKTMREVFELAWRSQSK